MPFKDYERRKAHIYAYRLAHPEKIKDIAKRGRMKQKREVFELLGNKCVRCGFSDPRALQIDHINGHGLRERKQFKSFHSYLNHVIEQIKKGSKDYQLLCANCNWIKKSENDENSR